MIENENYPTPIELVEKFWDVYLKDFVFPKKGFVLEPGCGDTHPFPTITAGGTHIGIAISPAKKRATLGDVKFRFLQARELSSASGFPNDYQFCGGKMEQIKQIGNAVPPPLIKAIISEYKVIR